MAAGAVELGKKPNKQSKNNKKRARAWARERWCYYKIKIPFFVAPSCNHNKNKKKKKNEKFFFLKDPPLPQQTI